MPFASKQDLFSAVAAASPVTPFCKSVAVNGQNTFDLPTGTMVYTNNTRLFHLEELTPTEVTVRVWIEGEDPQCDDDVQDAQLSVQLGFVGCDNNNVPIA